MLRTHHGLDVGTAGCRHGSEIEKIRFVGYFGTDNRRYSKCTIFDPGPLVYPHDISHGI